MENKMKKLVRSLSTRTKQRSTTTTSPSSPSTASGPPSNSDLSAPARKASVTTNPIPSNTVIHFRKCAHTTPPTPRPAHIPPVLRTEIIESSSPTAPAARVQDLEITGSREEIVPAGLETPTKADEALTTTNVQIKQYFSSPARCLDCTLSLARERETYLRDQSSATIRELSLRLKELSAAVRAVTQLARTKNATYPDGIDGRLNAEDIEEIDMIEADEAVLKADVESEKKRGMEEIESLWEGFRGEWQGGVRGVVRGDGTGEAEERCVFVFPWEDSDAARESVQVKWVPIDG